MQYAPILENERTRLQALLDYQILDTLPEENFDDLTMLASQVCQTPIALISLIDEKRQWFKSKIGLTGTETAREISFCGHAIHSPSTFIVKDSSKDERFFDNPTVINAPHAIFYAGAPLRTPSGEAIGTLCVVDHEPRELSPEQISFLEILSRQVIAQLELRKYVKYSQDQLREIQTLSKTINEQQKMIQNQEKLATIGGLASGLAHELNNPMAIIVGGIRVAMGFFENGQHQEGMEFLKKIESASFRASQVVGELMKVSNQPPENFTDAQTIEKAFMDSVAKSRSPK